jgi:hypothetical protein
MTRNEMLEWLRAHSELIRVDPQQLLDRVEAAVRRRAAEDAWLAAKDMAVDEARRWHERSHAMPCPEEWAAREVCHELARDMRRHEPRPDEQTEHWLDAETLAGLAPEARERLAAWVRELSGQEEHRVWLEVMRFTDQRSRSLAREGVVSGEEGWEESHSYAETAERVADQLAHDFEDRAKPRR